LLKDFTVEDLISCPSIYWYVFTEYSFYKHKIDDLNEEKQAGK
jgi:hypothetical protein